MIRMLALISVIILLLSSYDLFGAVAFDQANSGHDTAEDNNHSFTLNVTASAADVVIIVQAYSRSTTSVSTVDVGGTAATFIDFNDIPNGGRMETWSVAKGDDPGNQTITVTWSAEITNKGMGAMGFTGANQTTPVANQAKATGASTAPSATVNSAVDRMIAGAVFSRRDNTDADITPGGGQTQRWTNGASNNQPQSEGTTEAGAAPNVVTDWTLGTSADWGVIAADIDIAGAAAPRRIMVIGGLLLWILPIILKNLVTSKENING